MIRCIDTVLSFLIECIVFPVDSLKICCNWSGLLFALVIAAVVSIIVFIVHLRILVLLLLIFKFIHSFTVIAIHQCEVAFSSKGNKHKSQNFPNHYNFCVCLISNNYNNNSVNYFLSQFHFITNNKSSVSCVYYLFSGTNTCFFLIQCKMSFVCVCVCMYVKIFNIKIETVISIKFLLIYIFLNSQRKVWNFLFYIKKYKSLNGLGWDDVHFM